MINASNSVLQMLLRLTEVVESFFFFFLSSFLRLTYLWGHRTDTISLLSYIFHGYSALIYWGAINGMNILHIWSRQWGYHSKRLDFALTSTHSVEKCNLYGRPFYHLLCKIDILY